MTVWVLTHTWYDDIIEIHETKENTIESMREYILYNPELKEEDFRIREEIVYK